MIEPSIKQTLTARDRWRRILGFLGVDARPGEGAIAALLFLFCFLAITFQYVSKAVRQSKFMDSLGAEMLPIVYLLLAVCAIPVIMLYNRAADRFQRHHVIAGTCAAVALSIVGFSFVIQSDATWVPIAFYIWVSIAYVLIVSQFWAYSNFALNPRQGKRLFGFIGAGGLTGGLTGATIASVVSGMAGTRTTLLISAAVLGLAVGAIYLIQRKVTADLPAVDAAPVESDRTTPSKGGLEAILESRHLTLIAGLMFLTVVVANIIDLQFNWAMVKAFPDVGGTDRLDALTGGYGDFYVLMNVSALIFQLLFTARIHRKLGVGFAMRVLPLTMMMGTAGIFAAFTVAPGLLLHVCRLLKIGENGLRYSLDQSTRELLFFPVPAGDRLKAKAYIDVLVQRSGKAGAGLLLLPVTFGLMDPVQAGWISLVLIGGWMAITFALKKEYVRSFRDSLRETAADAHLPVEFDDATALGVVTQTLGSSEPRHVMHGLGLLEYFGKTELVPEQLVRHDSAEIRRKTVALLAADGRAEATPLIERALKDGDSGVRSEALHAMVALRGNVGASAMISKLDEPSLQLRSAAIVSILSAGSAAGRDDARAALRELVASSRFEDRRAACGVLAELPEPDFQEDLVQLLYDGSTKVQLAAIAAVATRVDNGGNNPIFVPTLISLMRDRRLKHEARAALTGYGDSVIAALAHFMSDPQEQLWVRRALPKTVAQVGGPTAAAALLGSLDAPDHFMRRKVIAALQWMRTHDATLAFDRATVSEQISYEARLYFLTLTDLVSIGGTRSFELRGPRIVWIDSQPLLLQRMFADRMDGSVDNIFRLLALIHPVANVRAAAQGLMSDNQRLRSHALEFFDNTLKGEVHRAAFAVFGDTPLQKKLDAARAEFQVAVQAAELVLGRLVLASHTNDEAAHWLGSAAMQAIVELEVQQLYPQLVEAAARNDETLVKETAIWATGRLGLKLA